MTARYTPTARWLHWLTLAVLLAVAVLGTWITGFEPADEALKLRLYALHESLGFTLLPLTLLRLAWRAGHPPPPLPEGLAPPQRLAAQATHLALYLLLLGQPLVGLLATNAWGFPFSWFGLLPIPSPVGKDEALAPLLSTLHWYGALALGGLVALHLAAALWHQLVRRDGLLRRML